MSEQVKHSPTPWEYKDQNLTYGITDAKGFYLGLIQYSGHVVNEANAAHIVKCVNLHDELVEACKAALVYPQPPLVEKALRAAIDKSTNP